jgi:hypothetical protein
MKFKKTNHLTNRLKQCQKEVQDWKKSYEEEHIRNETNIAKFIMYEDNVRNLKEQLDESHNQVRKYKLKPFLSIVHYFSQKEPTSNSEFTKFAKCF